MSVYPSGLDSFTPVVSGVSEIRSVDINTLQQAISSIQSALGSGVSNGYVLRSSSYMEEPSGVINGVNTVYTLAHTPISGTLYLHKNGLLMLPSGSNTVTFDYTLSGNTLTYALAPSSGSVHTTNYKY
jgi:hypothetical protein